MNTVALGSETNAIEIQMKSNTAMQDNLLHQKLVDVYLNFTNNILPQIALKPGCNWPIQENHCFQRVILDNLFNGVWQTHLSSPAYKNMSINQLKSAINTCENIRAGSVSIYKLNQQSIDWRKQQRTQQLNLIF